MDASSCSSMMCAHQVSDPSAWPVESSLWVPLQPTRTHRQQVWVLNGRYQNTLHMCASSSRVICSNQHMPTAQCSRLYVSRGVGL